MKHIIRVKTYIIYIICVCLAVSSILFLAACGEMDNDVILDVYGDRDSSVLEAYIYRPFNILSIQQPYPMSGVLVDGDNIVYWYVDSTPDVVVTTVSEDGLFRQRTVIPTQTQGWRVSVGGLQITDDDNIALIKVEEYETGGAVVTYGVYDRDGIEIAAFDISDTVARGNSFVRIKQTVFADDGSLVIVIDEAGPFNDVFLLNDEGKSLGLLQINSALNITKLRDGRVVALQRERFVEGAGVSLREIDFIAGDWGDSISLTIPNSNRLLAAGADQGFDLIVNDGRLLYGYLLETHTQTPLLDWTETGVIPTFDDFICFLPDDRIVILQTEVLSTNDESEWSTDFFVLSRFSRDELPQKTVITIGGYFFDEGIRREVIAFNDENQEYRLELQEIAFSDLDRLRVEMVTTGQGPDIFLDHPNFPVGSVFYADLYPFMDADPVISRTDFFQSVLKILETSDGRLPIITQHFYLTTNITMRETAAQIEPLTFTNLLRRLNAPDAPHLYGIQATREHYVFQLINSSGDTFIDMTNNKAYLDSDEFISLLEITYRLPEYQGEAGGTVSEIEEIERVRNGEQLLLQMMLHDLGNFRYYRALLGDIVIVGNPTSTGGRHAITMQWERFGISATSKHQDAAWSFVRRFFLPETVVPPYGLPIRIDKYEKIIAELMIPNIVNGEVVPQKISWYSHALEVYAMTPEEAAVLKEAIDTVSFAWRQDDIIDAIFSEVMPPFLSGSRSAQETARILQNRVQRYLDERG